MHTVRGVGYVLRSIARDELPPAHGAAGGRRGGRRDRDRVGRRVRRDRQRAARADRREPARRSSPPAAAGRQVQTVHRQRGAARQAASGKASCRPRDCRGSPSAGRRSAHPARPEARRTAARISGGEATAHRPAATGKRSRSKRNDRVRAGRPCAKRHAPDGARRARESCRQARAADPTLGGADRLRPAVPVRTGRFCAPKRARGSLLPVTAATRAVAAGRREAFFSDATVGGTPVRSSPSARPKEGCGRWRCR